MPNKRNVSIALVAAILVSTFGGFFTPTVNAAALTSVRDVLEDSRPSTASNHEIYFVTSSGIATSETLTLTFDPAGQTFDLGSLALADIDLAVDTDGTPGDCTGTLTDATLAGAATATDWGVAINNGTDVITFTAPSGGTPVAAASCVQIEIGDNATGGTVRIVNPAAQGTYRIDIAGTMADSGSALIAVIDTITATVTVDEALTFTVSGVLAANCTGGDVDTSASSVPFGTTTGNLFIDACQQMEVSTNGTNGYNTTVVQSSLLTSGVDTIAEGTCDGACDDTTYGAWATATNNGFGYCLEDVSGTDANALAADQCNDATPGYKTFPTLDTDTPEIVMLNNAPVSASQAQLNYRLSVPGNQAAGTYSNNIVLVTTPSY